MKTIEYSGESLALYGLMFVVGSYSFYRELQPPYMQTHIDTKTLVKNCTIISASAASAVAGAWGFVKGGNILNSKIGLAAFVTSFALIPAIAGNARLANTRKRADSDDDTFALGMAGVESVAAGTAASLVASGVDVNSTSNMSALAASVTFPTAAVFFTYGSSNSDLSLAAKIAIATAGVAGIAALVTPRLGAS